MYFNNLPQGFGQAPVQQPQNIMETPMMGYNQGIAGLNTYNQQMAKPASPAPQLPTQASPTATNAIAGIGGNQMTPVMPYQRPPQVPFGTAPSMNRPVAGQAMANGGVVAQNLAKHGVVAEGIAALRGQHPNPRGALDAYDRTFGPDATAELIKGYADGGVVSGPGSGVADLVPGSIDGREDVRIASGEYVIPAWAVAALGDGSTEAGARILDDMVARLRAEGSEKIMGTDPINPSEFLPA